MVVAQAGRVANAMTIMPKYVVLLPCSCNRGLRRWPDSFKFAEGVMLLFSSLALWETVDEDGMRVSSPSGRGVAGRVDEVWDPSGAAPSELRVGRGVG